jgi:hypothetical protein
MTSTPFTVFQQNILVSHAAAPPEVYFNEDDFLLNQLLQENLQHDNSFNYKRSAECLNFLQFSGSMLLAFPVGLLMRKRIRKNKRLNYILQFKELLSVRNNIEKGSFAYDTLLFKQPAFQLLKNKSHLANLVCLAILFGDEFIDGIATAHGKQNIQHILNNDAVDYYLHYKKNGNSYQLYYAFDICDVLPAPVLETVNDKYGITYRAFYSHLQFLLSEMNIFLAKLTESIGEEAAQLVCKACNKCFDTYKTDINGFNENYSLTDLLQYQKTKDDDIIQVLLTLRAVLLNKKQLQFQKQFSSWSSMVRSMQLYDDMQDVAADCNFQMNILCFFAKNYFNNEWQWLQQHKERLQKCKGLELHSSISVYMPASCIIAMQYARNIAHSKLNWVQRKVQNYLWCKNWLGYNNPLLNEKGFCLSLIMNKKDNSLPLKFYFLKKQAMQISSPLITDAMKWAHIIDVALMDNELKRFIFKRINKTERYCLNSCYLEYPVEQKALLAKKILSIQ